VRGRAVVAAQAPLPPAEWRYYGGNKGFTRYSALDQINRDNVKSLRIAWRRPAVNDKMIAAFPDTRPNAYLRATPIMIDGVLYTQDAHGLVIALDGETGRTIWEQPFGSDREDARGASTRGVDYWRGGTATRTAECSRFAANISTPSMRTTGVPVKTFGTQGRVLLRFTDRQPLAGRFNDSTGPLVLGNVVVVTGNTGGAW
jgi:quinoprotein glucose dehydrogenase